MPDVLEWIIMACVVGIALLVFGSVAFFATSATLEVVFKARRWYRIVKAAGQEFDYNGFRIYKHAEHGVYGLQGWDVIKPIDGPPGWLSGESKWAVGYRGTTGALYWTPSNGRHRRIPRWLRDDEAALESWRPVVEALDRHAHPWRHDDLAEEVHGPSPDAPSGFVEASRRWDTMFGAGASGQSSAR